MMTDEHKKKIGEANSVKTKEYWDNHPEHRIKMREAHKGQMPSDKTRERTRLRMFGGLAKRMRKLRKGNLKHGRSHTPEYRVFYQNQRRTRKYQAEGSHTIGEWELLKKQYGYACPVCERKEPQIKLTEDHIIPLTKGGSDFIENIQPLCGNCNSKKNTKIIKYD